MRIYVASSWRNCYQQGIVEILRDEGFDVYDFRNPREGIVGFHWSEIDPNWKVWSVLEYIEGLKHPIAQKGYMEDSWAMIEADVCVLVLPSGKSSHLEAGFFVGVPDKKLIILMLERQEPELMYKMADYICTSVEEIIEILKNGGAGSK